MDLHRLESTLVYFATSLRANNTVMDRLTRYKRLEQYPDDRELLDDVIVELRQAIEMTGIYRDDIKGTRELFSAILDNRLNNAMKFLSSITLIMAVPTVISGLYGMNVNAASMPFVAAAGLLASCAALSWWSASWPPGCCTKSTCCNAVGARRALRTCLLVWQRAGELGTLRVFLPVLLFFKEYPHAFSPSGGPAPGQAGSTALTFWTTSVLFWSRSWTCAPGAA